MRTIYVPKGRAAEYAGLALNIYTGCSHGCLYCYVPGVTHNNHFGEPRPRPGLLEALQKEAAKYQGDPRHVLLSFACDPYQPLDVSPKHTRQAIEILHFYGLHVSILTKAGLNAKRDFDLLGPGDKFGVTLTLLNDADYSRWEPLAAPPLERIQALRQAKARGIPTWVSLEPVLDPIQTIALIGATFSFVDEFKVGVLNYVLNDTDWARFARDVVEVLDSLGCHYYLKADLRRYLKVPLRI